MFNLIASYIVHYRFRRAGTGTSAMVSNLIIAIAVITSATVVGMILGKSLSGNAQIAVNAFTNMFGGS